MNQKPSSAADHKALARHWMDEMAANNAIENNPLTGADRALFERAIRDGLSPQETVALVIAEHRARQELRLNAAE